MTMNIPYPLSPFMANVCMLCIAALFAAAFMMLYRIIVGPTAADRAIGFDSLSAVFVAIICVMCVMWNSTLYFDAVWILTLVGFIGSASIAKYIEKGRVF